MPYDVEERESENRKLEALTAISVAIASLGKSLILIVEQNSNQVRKLDLMDRKLDRILELAEARAYR